MYWQFIYNTLHTYLTHFLKSAASTGMLAGKLLQVNSI